MQTNAKKTGTQVDWIGQEVNEGLKRNELLELYRVYQERQMGDLDMHFRFANYYAAALTALVTAFVLGFVHLRKEPEAGFMAFVPLLVILLVHQGKLTTFRFYRRYTEGRVRLTKIEYLLGLCGRIDVEKLPAGIEAQKKLWPDDCEFLPHRYLAQSLPFSSSSEFIHERAWRYGLGKLTQKTFNIFYAFSWGALIWLPVALNFSASSRKKIAISCASSGIGLAIALVSTIRYQILRKTMVGETPD